MKQYILFIFCCIILYSCTTSSSFNVQQVDKQSAIIYFYRPWSILGLALNLSVAIDRTTIINLAAGNHSYIKTTRDNLSIFYSQDIGEFYSEIEVQKLSIEHGRIYYIKLLLGYDYSSPPHFFIMDKEDALKDIKKTNFIASKIDFFY
jgi:hypothetical protein